MQNRTIIRTALDKFFDNTLVDTISNFVNFCNDQSYFQEKELKFLKKMPINKVEALPLEKRMLFKVTK